MGHMNDHGSASEAAQPTSSAAAEACLAEMAALQATALSQAAGLDLPPREHLAAQVQPPDVEGVVAEVLSLARTGAVEGALLQMAAAAETISTAVVEDWKQQVLVSWPSPEDSGVGLAARWVEEVASSIDVGVVADWNQQALVSWPSPEDSGVGLAARWVEEAAAEGLSLAASSVARWADELSASSLVSPSLLAGLEVLATSPMHESVATALRAAGDRPTSWAGAAIATLPSGSDLWPDVAASWWDGEPTGAFAAVELLSEHLAKVPTVTATSLLSSGLSASIDDVLN